MSSSGSSRFLSAYYVGNVLVLASYALLRPLAEPATRVGPQSKLASYEQQAAVTLLASFGLKVMRVHSPDHLASLMFMYAKAALLALSYFASPLMLAITTLEVTALWLLTTPPFYDGPSRITTLTPELLDSLLVADPPSDAQTAWVVMLYAHWHVPSIFFAPAFARLSVKYGGLDDSPLRFASLDLGRWPGLASRYGVDMTASASQLPTLVLLQGGKEVDRVPRRAAGGGVVRGQWKESDVVEAFELASRSAVKGEAKTESVKKNE